MILNPLRRRRERKAAEQRKLALAGRTTSGHATQGDRDRMFRNRKRRS